MAELSGQGAKGIGSTEGSSYASSAASMTRSFGVKQSDTNDLIMPTRVLYIGCAGTIKYTMVGGDVRTRTLPAGYHPLQIKKIWATGTTIADTDMEGHV